MQIKGTKRVVLFSPQDAGHLYLKGTCVSQIAIIISDISKSFNTVNIITADIMF